MKSEHFTRILFTRSREWLETADSCPLAAAYINKDLTTAIDPTVTLSFSSRNLPLVCKV